MTSRTFDLDEPEHSTEPHPTLSVLMTVRDAAPYLAEAIDSIRAQTWTDWELVVVDDASRDDSVAIVERFRRIDPRVRLIRRSVAGGPYVAANEGLRYVRGRYVARMDADDVSLPHRLQRQLDFLGENPGLRACAADAMMLVGKETFPIRVREMPTLAGAIKWGVCIRGFLQGASLVETDAFVELGGYRELPAAQDHRLWCELSRRRWLGALPEVVLHYRKHDQQLSETRLARQQLLAAEAVRDHIFELTGELWRSEDIHALRSIGHGHVGWKAGRGLIRRFEGLWRSDNSLSVSERHELERLTRRLRFEHLRETVRRSLSAHLAGRALLRVYTRVHTAWR